MLALLPLDDRPCNVRFPRQIAAIGDSPLGGEAAFAGEATVVDYEACGSTLRVPPHELLGRFNTPGQPERLGNWLLALPAIEALIVSVDMLAYGGLVASRRPHTPVAQALANLQVLRQFREARPGTPIYGFNVLMRLAVTMDSDEAAVNYYNVMRYARLADEAERFDSEHLRAELARVQNEIPATVLSQYLAARARNHDVNGVMLDWLHAGVFDYLLITQEDATEYGLHRREQDVLLRHAARLGVRDKMSLHPGADEAALTLLARHWNTGVSFRLHGSNRADMRRIALFEDRPYADALAQQVVAMRGVLQSDAAGDNVQASHAPDGAGAVASPVPADFELFVNAPVGGSQKDENKSARTARAVALAPFLDELVAKAQAGALVALCDVAFPNGADNVLMNELDRRRALGLLTVYGGWNTAGNTTGTVLAQCAALKRAMRPARVTAGMNGAAGSGTESGETAVPEKAARLNRQFTFERLVDDWFYQSQVRVKVEKAAREAGISPLNMGDEAAMPIEALTRRELRGLAQITAKRHYGATIAHSEITLPWARTFEADVRIALEG